MHITNILLSFASIGLLSTQSLATPTADLARRYGKSVDHVPDFNTAGMQFTNAVLENTLNYEKRHEYGGAADRDVVAYEKRHEYGGAADRDVVAHEKRHEYGGAADRDVVAHEKRHE
jgi:hypothetical protein